MTNLWTDANIERLKTLFFAGKSMAEISALIPGSTRNGVIGKLHRLNLRDENRDPKERKLRKPKPPTALPEQKSPADGFSFADLEPGMCKWPLDQYLYCGAPARGGRKPYCTAHWKKSVRA